ncbi:hypothetical protein PV10_05069 [Exophiala mesophila]|uniref:Uncharacterized protein n=1 Tax=Exophiala mesophila TaxID=212818 RepID=A0A0D1WWX0_EXOME|nr:uncharacterized protein PV10_05069 [Exophiala mesophila]KIV93890.1 hypothetical protein PV10_05069 [Exophiala mesophila]
MQWPPSPLVEDEDVSLAKECIARVPLESLKTDNQGAHSRGPVDQYPIILDNVGPEPSLQSQPPAAQKPCELTPDNSSIDEQQEPKSPSSANTERRFVFIPSNSSEPKGDNARQTDSSNKTKDRQTLSPPIIHRSKSTTQLKDQDSPRGRPHVSRIHTDVGTEPGERRQHDLRAPSPYAHTYISSRTSTRDNLLSPMDAHHVKRPVSVHPRSKGQLHDSSDSDHKPRSKRHHERSRSRAPRYSPSQAHRTEPQSSTSQRSRSIRRRSPDSKAARDDRRYRSRGPAEGGVGHYIYTDPEGITPPQTPKPPNDSARSSTLDTGFVAGPPATKSNKRGVLDSPYTSSAEESQGRQYGTGDEKRSAHRARSRRGSRLYRDRDSELRSLYGHEQAPQDKVERKRLSKDYDLSEPALRGESIRSQGSSHRSSKDAKDFEDVFVKAMAANDKKRTSNIQSRPASPLSSAPQSPPHTPRGESSARDYFEPPSSSKAPAHTSRPNSAEDARYKDFKTNATLLGVATLGASIASKIIPSLSRSNTNNSLESPSSSSNNRSRKSSPILVDGALPSPPASAPVTRHNSYASRDDNIISRSTTHMSHDERGLPSNVVQSPVQIDVPRSASRAASYSYSPDQHRPPAPFRAQSSNLATNQPTMYVYPQPPQPTTPAFFYHEDMGKAVARLPPCSRPKPVAGYHDWYTIRELGNVQFCPACTKLLGASPFRSYLVPRFSQDPGAVGCSMGQIWFRIGWVQTTRQPRQDFKLLRRLCAEPPPSTMKCMGSRTDIRRWYHLTDPRSKRPVEGFDVCSSCVRNLDMIFPQLLECKLFDRPTNTLSKEKVCTLNTSSRHFLDIITDLDRLAIRQQKGYLQDKDVEGFVDHVRGYCRYRECRRDTMLDTLMWHHIHDLPELTICEDCYMDFVWPLVNRPIAREVSKSLTPVPARRRNQMIRGISCQLYSPRMRAIFLNTVNRNDFETLKAAAIQRFEMEHRCQEMHRRLEEEMKLGIDRSTEIEDNIKRWQAIE